MIPRKIPLTVSFLIVILVITLAGCDRNSKTLSVHSTDYNGLTVMTEGSFDMEAAKSWYLDDNPYRNNTCYITVRDGSIFVENRYYENGTYLLKCDYGYFMGVNFGVYDGWVRYYPYNSGELELDNSVVANENCLGFIMVSDEKAYLLTCDNFDAREERGRLYELICDRENRTWKWNIVCEIEGTPLGFTFDGEKKAIYVITDVSIVVIDDNYKMSAVAETKYPAMVAPTSVAVLGGNLYCGSPMGIYEFMLDSGEEIWYPMDYSRYVK